MATKTKRNKAYDPNKAKRIRAAAETQVALGNKTETKISGYERMEQLADAKAYNNRYLPTIFHKTIGYSIEGIGDTNAYLMFAANPPTESASLIQEVLPFYDIKDLPFTWDILNQGDLLPMLHFSHENRELTLHTNPDGSDNTVLYELRAKGVRAYWNIQVELGMMQLPLNEGMLLEDICNVCKTKSDTEAFAKRHNLILGYEELEIQPDTHYPLWDIVHETDGELSAHTNRAWRDSQDQVHLVTIFDVLADTIVNYLSENEGYTIFSLTAKLTVLEKKVNV